MSGLIEHMKSIGRVHITRGTARFRKLQYAEIEHVSISADCCVLLTQLSAVVRTVPHGPIYITWMRSLAYVLRIRTCPQVSASPQGCAVPYGAVRHHADTCVADTHGTARYVNAALDEARSYGGREGATAPKLVSCPPRISRSPHIMYSLS